MSDLPERPLRVHQTFAPVKDFARDERGDVIWDSLKGPDRLEAQAQYARERIIGLEETKILRYVISGRVQARLACAFMKWCDYRERVRWCYRREGVNHLENCKDVVAAYLERVEAPNYGMLKVRLPRFVYLHVFAVVHSQRAWC
jgi:hypothetical protein